MLLFKSDKTDARELIRYKQMLWL